MAIPVLIDTDMGIDDSVAVALAIASKAVDLRAVVAVGGAVDLDQAAVNIARVLDAIAPSAAPLTGRGLEAESKTQDRRGILGEDGLGNWDHAVEGSASSDFREVYQQAIASADGKLNILTTGPLTNLAAIASESPDLLEQVEHIHVGGGAVWAQGNVNGKAEFNFHADPTAAGCVLSSGRPITVTPLDVTGLVCMDQSHVAHLAASTCRTGQMPAQILEHLLESDEEPAYGKTFVAAGVAAASIIWPDLFLKTRMRLAVGDDGGCKPGLGGDKSLHVDLLTAVNAVDLLENMLESLCNEAFVV